MLAAKTFFFSMVGLLLVIIGIGIGRFSYDNSVPPLPTGIPSTPINFNELVNATPQPYAFLDATLTPMPALSGDLARGQELYAVHQCGHCHGLTGGGEPGNPNPFVPDNLGYMLIPRHDSYGKTWMHPDQLLVDIIKQGARNPFYRLAMPSFEDVLTDNEIMLIIDYMRLFWTEEQREHQAAITERLRIARE